ncbi:multidrug ABC transporter permease [Ralstonia solanacearum]|nr:multidrug ABC transporter permease [Ralstonia solanacearum]
MHTHADGAGLPLEANGDEASTALPSPTGSGRRTENANRRRQHHRAEADSLTFELGFRVNLAREPVGETEAMGRRGEGPAIVVAIGAEVPGVAPASQDTRTSLS